MGWKGNSRSKSFLLEFNILVVFSSCSQSWSCLVLHLSNLHASLCLQLRWCSTFNTFSFGKSCHWPIFIVVDVIRTDQTDDVLFVPSGKGSCEVTNGSWKQCRICQLLNSLSNLIGFVEGIWYVWSLLYISLVSAHRAPWKHVVHKIFQLWREEREWLLSKLPTSKCFLYSGKDGHW